MTTLREAAQQALEALEAFLSDELRPYEAAKTSDALRAALAQQDEPLNLRDPAVQKRLATQWGYVPAAQAEPVEPVAWLAPDGSVRETPAAKSFGEWVWGPDDFRPLYTAPPQRKPLTEEEILAAVGWERAEMYMKLATNFPVDEAKQETLKNARAVERAVWEKNNG